MNKIKSLVFLADATEHRKLLVQIVDSFKIADLNQYFTEIISIEEGLARDKRTKHYKTLLTEIIDNFGEHINFKNKMKAKAGLGAFSIISDPF